MTSFTYTRLHPDDAAEVVRVRQAAKSTGVTIDRESLSSHFDMTGEVPDQIKFYAELQRLTDLAHAKN